MAKIVERIKENRYLIALIVMVGIPLFLYLSSIYDKAVYTYYHHETTVDVWVYTPVDDGLELEADSRNNIPINSENDYVDFYFTVWNSDSTPTIKFDSFEVVASLDDYDDDGAGFFDSGKYYTYCIECDGGDISNIENIKVSVGGETFVYDVEYDIQ